MLESKYLTFRHDTSHGTRGTPCSPQCSRSHSSLGKGNLKKHSEKSFEHFQLISLEFYLLQGQIGAEWRLNRTAAVIATLGHEVQDSTDDGSSYDATTARVGLRLQR